MAQAKDFKPRTFVKKGPDGEKITRTVTGPGSEVEAKFDGFHEETATAKPSSGGSSAGGGKSTASS